MFAWIVESGASRHMIGRCKYLMHLHPISLCYIELSNSAHTIVAFEGTLKLESRFVFTSVFYISNLTCNLLSVSQLLCYHSTYDVHFLRTFVLYKTLLRRWRLERIELFMGCIVLLKNKLIIPRLFPWTYYINI